MYRSIHSKEKESIEVCGKIVFLNLCTDIFDFLKTYGVMNRKAKWNGSQTMGRK